jgi:multidrug efflux pump subunit AcrA (membrane-fusion protein)
MKYVILAVVLIVLGGGIAAFWYTRVANAASSGAPAQGTAKVTRGDLEVSVQATGSVASNNDVDIKCRASGMVLKLPYDISDEVPAGAMLVTLDKDDEQRALDQANAQLDYDEARLQEAKLEWEVVKLNLVTTRQRVEATLSSSKAKAADAEAKRDRTQELFDKKLASKEDLETAQTAAVQAAAEVQMAQAAVAELEQQKIQVDSKEQDINLVAAQKRQDAAKQKLAEQAVEYCVVKAPTIDDPTGQAKWTVSAILVKIGTLVQSGTSSVSGGAVVMTLSDLSHLYVMATVDESDIGQVQTDQHVHITSDSYKGIKFEGKVVRIATKGVSISNVVTFEVKIEVTSRNRLLLKPMMTANVDIISSEKKDVLLVPMQAVSRKHFESADDADRSAATTSGAEPEGVASTRKGREKKNSDHPKFKPGPVPATVQVQKPEGGTEAREIQIGISDDINYEVVKGLEEGETVLLNKAGANSKFASGRTPRSGR